MGRGYRQLTLEDRSQLAQLQAQGCSLRQIAATLDRAPSTIAREVKRNGRSRQRGYLVAYAHQQAQARRWRGSQRERNAELREQVLVRRQAGWSPEQVSGRLARDAGRPLVSYETIYRFIDAQIRRGKEYDWRHSRPRGKAKRGRRARKGAVSRIPQRQGLDARPPEVATRQTFGHWAADLMLFSRLRSGRAGFARAPLPADAGLATARRQGRRNHRRGYRASPGQPAGRGAAERHL